MELVGSASLHSLNVFQSINQSISLSQATRPINTQTHKPIGRQTHTYRNREIKRQVPRDTNVHTQKAVAYDTLNL